MSLLTNKDIEEFLNQLSNNDESECTLSSHEMAVIVMEWLKEFLNKKYNNKND